MTITVWKDGGSDWERVGGRNEFWGTDNVSYFLTWAIVTQRFASFRK